MKYSRWHWAPGRGKTTTAVNLAASVASMKLSPLATEKKMSEAEESGGVKKKGNVVIISDSRIAGKQGMLIRKTEKRFVCK